MRHRTGIVFALIAAAAIGSLTTMLLSPEDDGQHPGAAKTSDPLYWVAPMDPSYRRDAPGKSPMGMDLVPVYDESVDEPPGTVRIQPSVVSNLGVRIEAAEKRTLQPRLRTVGFVRWDEDRLTHEHPRVSGWIERLFVKAAGDPVKKNEPLYSLYSPDLVNAQEELVLALRRDDKSLARAARARLSALQVPDSLVSAIEADGRVRQTVTFTASQDGIVDELPIREGFYVEPGTTLMAIGALDSVWIEAAVLERQANQVRVGMPLTMTADYYPGRSWAGRVDYVYPSLNPSTRTLRLRLRFDNPDEALRPNMYVRVVLEGGEGDAVVAVPRKAVIRTADGDRVVLALGEGRFRAIPVQLGASDEQFIEVLSGVVVGDRVVTSAQFLLDSESSQRAGLERLSALENERDSSSDTNEDARGSAPIDHESTDHGDMDHGPVTHDPMGHDPVDRDSMDHSTMDHDTMNHDASRKTMDQTGMSAGQMEHGRMAHDADSNRDGGAGR